MIIGIGTDITDIRRIERSLFRHGKNFMQRVFTESEIAYATSGRQDIKAMSSILAKRWAAKEAVVKALGIGFGNGLYWRDIEILREANQPPRVRISKPNCVKEIDQLTFHITMSDEYPYAIAYALVEKR